MTKIDLLAKIEAMAVKMQQQNQPTEQPTETQKVEPIAPTQEKSKLVSFKLLWSEATSQYDNVQVKTWRAANELLLKVGRCAKMELNSGYNKTKIEIVWENGHTITDRLDLSLNGGDFNPFKQSVQDYLKPQKGVIYESNLQQGDRLTLLSWEDEEAEPTPQPEQTTAPEQNNLTETPTILKQLLGIVDTIEESKDSSEIALKKASEQVEKAKAYILYLQSILPILEAKVNAMIEAKHKPTPIKIENTNNFQLN